ncbi:hypothetical protein Dred_1249 [Desulforamulus reducens MI-1]|uniref:Uncharacterized protein n=1 Tax=Desulforamulus reducens (strain ATCC BAA-1160 / DSM 100696 / MI-1) TaxID=349161 RepID=A4J3Y0_DESRM|nr:hypothetical protein [Desulforamulus reducens]ABO49783.1 hypothetical protein Dred_1249 [Desulforamulus reducens MI-1]
MAGDRGSGYSAFSLFLIFILLYLSQQGTKASAYHQDNKKQDKSSEEKVAVGLSDGEVMEYSPSPTADYVEDMSEGEQNIPVIVEETDHDMSEEVGTDDLFEDLTNNEKEQLEETKVIEETVVSVVEEEVEVEVTNEVENEVSEVTEDFEPTNLTEPTDTIDTIEPQDNGQADVVEALESEEKNTDQEPVLGGQNNLFLKPTVMSGLGNTKQQAGPKISIKFGG